MRNRKQVLILIIFLAIGTIIGSSNYQFQIERIEAGTWVNVPVLIEKPELAGTWNQYIDATQSSTYGTVTDGPPSGMGEDTSGNGGDTHLEEASYIVGGGWQSEDSEYFGSAPAGWSIIFFTVSGGIAFSHTDTELASMTTEAFDMSSYYAIRIHFDYASDNGPNWIEAGDWILQINAGSGWVEEYSIPARTSGVLITSATVSETTSDSGVQYRWKKGTASSNEHIRVDSSIVERQLKSTYYRMDFVFRFDSVTTGLGNYFLYVDFNGAMGGSDDLDMYIETGDTTPDLFMCADNVQDDFSVNVTDYITGDTVYLRIFDDYRTGDTVQTEALIEGIYLYSADFEWYAVDDPAEAYFDTPDWDINNLLEFFFPVKITPDQQFGYDAFFIFLGLIMIPVSTMYLVRGGRKGMNADKFFYGVVIFAVGIGFLIGGILP